VTGHGERSTWKNTYPILGDTTYYHHESFYLNGALLHRVDYIGGKRSGHYQEFDSSGSVVLEGLYVNDLKHGGWRTLTGGLLMVRTFAHDTLSGPTYEELEDGRIVHGLYLNGHESGLWIWVRDGSLDQVAPYRNGFIDGTSTAYWPNGELRAKANYIAGDLVDVLYFDSLGNRSDSRSVRIKAE
jgi:antitoxin component YwqK of YwqJK toxin-antitoxin module